MVFFLRLPWPYRMPYSLGGMLSCPLALEGAYPLLAGCWAFLVFLSSDVALVSCAALEFATCWAANTPDSPKAASPANAIRFACMEWWFALIRFLVFVTETKWLNKKAHIWVQARYYLPPNMGHRFVSDCISK